MGDSNVYIDGFNLYRGCIEGTAYKWLDPRRLARELVRGCDLGTVHYFTARVIDRPENPGQSQRQDTYLDALATLDRVVIHEGHFRTRKKKVLLLKADEDGEQVFDIALVTEEKRTDVMLASRLVWDACHGHIGTAIVISNDSDFQESVDLAREKGVRVITVNPHHHKQQKDHLVGDDLRRIRRAHLERSQLPNEVRRADGATFRRPVDWA